MSFWLPAQLYTPCTVYVSFLWPATLWSSMKYLIDTHFFFVSETHKWIEPHRANKDSICFTLAYACTYFFESRKTAKSRGSKKGEARTKNNRAEENGEEKKNKTGNNKIGLVSLPEASTIYSEFPWSLPSWYLIRYFFAMHIIGLGSQAFLFLSFFLFFQGAEIPAKPCNILSEAA